MKTTAPTTTKAKSASKGSSQRTATFPQIRPFTVTTEWVQIAVEVERFDADYLVRTVKTPGGAERLQDLGEQVRGRILWHGIERHDLGEFMAVQDPAPIQLDLPLSRWQEIKAVCQGKGIPTGAALRWAIAWIIQESKKCDRRFARSQEN